MFAKCPATTAGKPKRKRKRILHHIVPCDDPEWIEKAYDGFKRNGFVIIPNLLSSRQCLELRQACKRVASEIVAPKRQGNRGPGRYSFGVASSTGSLLHIKPWAEHLLNFAGVKLKPLLDTIFGGASSESSASTDCFKSWAVLE